MSEYHLRIEGVARVKGRPRLGKNGVYTPEATRNWEELVGWEFVQRNGKPKLTGPIRVEVFFHQKQADIDNLVKAILDALNQIAYEDDSQVVELHARKDWTAKGAHWTDITVSRWLPGQSRRDG